MRFLNIPSLKLRTDLVLISTQKEDIDILMLSRLNSEKEIECPSASDPPGNRERGKEFGNFRWLPRLPWPKLICHVCRTIPFKQYFRIDQVILPNLATAHKVFATDTAHICQDSSG